VKVIYVVPGTGMGAQELERRRSILQSNSGKDVKVDIIESSEGPNSIESSYEEYLSIPETVLRVVDAQKKGYQGAILGCFGDPGIDAIREMVQIPVVGPGEASMLIAAMLGHKFSIVTILDNVIPSMEMHAKIIGIDSKLASIRSVNIPVLELAKDLESAKKKIIEESRNAKEHDGADTIILGCMSMAFLGVSNELQKTLGIPVINPAIVSLKILESLVICNLTHSKMAYPSPPKLNS